MTPPPKPHIDLTWQDHANCQGAPPEWFFADLTDEGLGGRPPNWNYDNAHALCVTCPVQPQCLEHALTRPERDGYWGDRTPTELRHLRGIRRRETAA